MNRHNNIGNLSWDQIYSTEKYWREHIAKEILLEFDGDNREVWLADVLSRCADIARGQK